MPYPGEHSARVRDPGDFQPDSFRRKELPKEKGKKSSVAIITGKLKGESSEHGSHATTAQAYRFPVDSYSVSQAKEWLKSNNVSYILFEPAAKKDADMGFEYSAPLKVMEIKSDGDDWEVEGYASTFNNIDLGNGWRKDKVLAGSFKWTLKEGPKTAFLLGHDPRYILGTPRQLKEDSHGLFSVLKISKTQLGQDTRQLLLDKALDSFSIGFEALDWKVQTAEVDGVEEEIRILEKIKLWEISLVPFPMNPKAQVTGVKSYMTLAERIQALSAEFGQALGDIREIADKDHPLSEAKRQQLQELLETFSGMDAVRADLQTLIDANDQHVTPSGLVAARQLSWRLNELRRKYSGQ